ncbi:MAG: CHAP domain-containing protein [Bacteroidota bacterium]
MRFLLIILFLSLNISFIIAQSDSLPEANKKILDFALNAMNKKVGNGECWTLAANALNSISAKWDKNMEFGKLLSYPKEKALAGDIIQFKNIKIKDGAETMTMAQHTGIITKVNDDGSIEIANQNVNGKKKVVISLIKLNKVVKGKFFIYRPQV